MTTWFDSHCHLQAPAFDADRTTVWARARATGVRHALLPATCRADWPRVAETCAALPGCLPAYGLHPQFMDRHRPGDLDALAKRLAAGGTNAVGECGLDFFDRDAPRAPQIALFEAQLDLAARFDLPVVIHARRSVQTVLERLRRRPGLRGVLHSYSGSLEQARQLLDLGDFRFGFGGPVTWPRSRRLQALVRALPAEALLLETDAPDQPDADHRGRRNEPAWLPTIGRFIAALRSMGPAELAARTHANAAALFGTAPRPLADNLSM